MLQLSFTGDQVVFPVLVHLPALHRSSPRVFSSTQFAMDVIPDLVQISDGLGAFLHTFP
jgi:hypothetical protein